VEVQSAYITDELLSIEEHYVLQGLD